MRPIKLAVQGLTAYRQQVEVDFSELDLFAITGPTGAGKSSLVDAITYALYGQVPRVGRSVRELISQGEDRLKVSLEFAVEGERYRIFRESGRKTQKPPQLERFDRQVNEWRPEDVERVKDTNAFIERLLRMDYEAFIRSVLLPQGEFQQFLAGDRDERRKVLDGLLRLGIYARMGQAANAIAARQTDAADAIARRLEQELGDATPAAVKAAKAELVEREREAKAIAAAREALDAACRTAEALGEALARRRKASEAQADAGKALAEAQEATRTGEEKTVALKAAVIDLEAKLAKNAYVEDEYLRYREASSIAADLAKDETAAAELAKQGATLESQIKTANAEAERESAAYARASEAAKQAADAFEDARRSNAAEALRQKLSPGDPCPVCGQAVHDVPHEKVPKLDDARVAAQKAKDAEDAARKADEAAGRALAQLQTRLESLAENQASAAKRLAERQARLAAALGGKVLPAAEIVAHVEMLEAARREREKLTRDLDDAKKSLNEIVASMAAATADLARLQAAVEAAERESKDATESALQAEGKLRGAATAQGWADVTQALDAGQDAPALLRGRLQNAQRREGDLRETVGAQRKHIEQIEANIEKAKELRAEEKRCREEASLARDLASLLRADAFPTFLRERALRDLAREGSRRLLEVSGGRYDFIVEGQDFLVEDRWNGNEPRSVKTLSGGETFLASLALALALAEQLPALSGDGSAGALESLFIDEGFSHLDNETLDIVASALEVLGQDRSRLIGVITHVGVLAERMPARITVHKTQHGSSVSID
ncbi:MAG: SMC family ATPase [Dehalococcoidia bacterium]